MARYQYKRWCDAEQWFPGKAVPGVIEFSGQRSHNGKPFGLLPGPRVIAPGDFVVTDMDGVKSGCDPKVFTEMYELMEN